MDKFKISEKTFLGAPEEQKEFLQLFSFICMLSFDVYVKRLLIEKIIDSMKEEKKEGGKDGRAGKKDV